MMKSVEDTEKQILFVDQIGFVSLLYIFPLSSSLKEIWYFEPISPFFQRLLERIQKIGLVTINIYRVNYNISRIRDNAGRNEFGNIRHSILELCKRIKEEKLVGQPLIKEMGQDWSSSKLLLHFGQLIEKEVNEECLRINLIKWIVQTQLSGDLPHYSVLIKRRQWFSYIKKYADSEGIILRAYTYWNPFDFFSKFFRIVNKIISPLLGRVFNNPVRFFLKSVNSSSKSAQKTMSKQSSKYTVAINYWYRTLSFDPKMRSEFFWLNGSRIPPSEILLYNYISDTPIDTETHKQLKTRNIKVLGSCPGIPKWIPTSLAVTTFLHVFFNILKYWFVSLAQKQCDSSYYLYQTIVLAVQYSYWYDFLITNRVRINIGTQNTSMAQAIAMDLLGIVSCSFQYSASNLCYPHHKLSSGDDVFFMFSSAFEEVWRSVESPVQNYVKVGYIYDSSFQETRNSVNINAIKNDLRSHGAKFIICYFDENSADQWSQMGSNKESAEDYEYLIQWLFEDLSLGLVFKPKKFSDLFQRIGETSKLIQKAESTGRCKFFADNFGNMISPAEVSLISNICIGQIAGITATMEACLVGVPSLIMDKGNLNFHPFYSWTNDRIIFNDWNDLRAAVEQFREDPQKYPDFGNWASDINTLDPYQDGKASLRMGSYIGWVYDALKAGESKQFALQSANEKFHSQWGNH
jgi:hypothetical protein